MIKLPPDLQYELSITPNFFNPDLKWVIEYVKPFYNQKDRFFHNFMHIAKGLIQIASIKRSGDPIFLSDEQFIAWLFHDIVYLPTSNKNEEISADVMRDFCEEYNLNIDVDIAYQIIIDTKKHQPSFSQSEIVLDMDMSCLGPQSYMDFVKERHLVIQEYAQYFGEEKSKKGVVDFLKNIKDNNIFHTAYFEKNQAYFKNHVALYIHRYEQKNL